MIDTHGDSPEPEKLALLEIGTTPYTEVMDILGSPSSRTIFDNEYWLYISSKQERMAFFEPKEVERKITVLKFGKDGILQGIEFKELKDGMQIVLSEDETKTSGHSIGLLDQFISNIGRFEQKKSGP